MSAKHEYLLLGCRPLSLELSEDLVDCLTGHIDALRPSLDSDECFLSWFITLLLFVNIQLALRLSFDNLDIHASLANDQTNPTGWKPEQAQRD